MLLYHQANFAVNVLKYLNKMNETKKSAQIRVHSSQDEISQFNDQIFLLLPLFVCVRWKRRCVHVRQQLAWVYFFFVIKRSATAVAYNLDFSSASRKNDEKS